MTIISPGLTAKKTFLILKKSLFLFFVGVNKEYLNTINGVTDYSGVDLGSECGVCGGGKFVYYFFTYSSFKVLRL